MFATVGVHNGAAAAERSFVAAQSAVATCAHVSRGRPLGSSSSVSNCWMISPKNSTWKEKSASLLSRMAAAATLPICHRPAERTVRRICQLKMPTDRPEQVPSHAHQPMVPVHLNHQ